MSTLSWVAMAAPVDLVVVSNWNIWQGHNLGCVLLAELRRHLFWLGLIRDGREGRIGDPLAWVLCPGRSDLVYDGHGERNSDVSIGYYIWYRWW